MLLLNGRCRRLTSDCRKLAVQQAKKIKQMKRSSENMFGKDIVYKKHEF